MKASILKEALKIQKGVGFSSLKQIPKLYFQKRGEFSKGFLLLQRGKRVKILDEKLFFSFLSEIAEVEVKSFEEIEKILNSSSRGENIYLTKDSKSSVVEPFKKGVLLKQRGKESFELFLSPPSNIKKIVAIENSETFLALPKLEELFLDYEWFLYLGGNPSKKVASFLKDKEVLFFLDWDIISLNFYERVEVKSKKLYLPNSFEKLLKEYGNTQLYLKQLPYLKSSYSPEVDRVIDLIQSYSKVLEQEVIDDPSRVT